MQSGVRNTAAFDRSLFAAARDTGESPDFREIDCVRHLLSRKVIAAAELRAARLGIGADRVLIASGALEEETYLRALADMTGVMFEALDGMPRTHCPLDDDRLIEAAAIGLLPLMINGGLVVVVAPREIAARRILAMIKETPATAARFRFTTAEHFNRFVLRVAGERLSGNASDALKQKWPAMSAALPYRLGNFVPLTPVALAIAGALFLAPAATARGFEILLAAIFVTWLALRIIGAFVPRGAAASLPLGHDHALPVYTIICALYQEASSVNGLLSAIERLDYPALGSKLTLDN